MSAIINNEIEVLFSKCTDYMTALSFMKNRVKNIISGVSPQAIWFLEHDHVYTAGTSAVESDLINVGTVPVYQVGRGGKHTYHGPGQRIVYFMLDLKKLHNGKPDLRLFVQQLEMVIINVLNDLGIKGFIKNDHVGMWVENDGKDQKIVALGIRVEKWVTYHGISINVAPDLKYFDGIVPCGIKEYGVTSLKEMGYHINLSEIDSLLLKHIKTLNNLNNLNII